jgi:hypothetical protein
MPKVVKKTADQSKLGGRNGSNANMERIGTVKRRQAVCWQRGEG